MRDEVERLGVVALEMHRWGGRWMWEESVNNRPDQPLRQLRQLKYMLRLQDPTFVEPHCLVGAQESLFLTSPPGMCGLFASARLFPWCEEAGVIQRGESWRGVWSLGF